jgi:hypothetical protein
MFTKKTRNWIPGKIMAHIETIMPKADDSVCSPLEVSKPPEGYS